MDPTGETGGVEIRDMAVCGCAGSMYGPAFDLLLTEFLFFGAHVAYKIKRRINGISGRPWNIWLMALKNEVKNLRGKVFRICDCETDLEGRTCKEEVGRNMEIY